MADNRDTEVQKQQDVPEGTGTSKIVAICRTCVFIGLLLLLLWPPAFGELLVFAPLAVLIIIGFLLPAFTARPHTRLMLTRLVCILVIIFCYGFTLAIMSIRVFHSRELIRKGVHGDRNFALALLGIGTVYLIILICISIYSRRNHK